MHPSWHMQSERHSSYWTSDYIWREQLYIPWLSRFWVWCKGGVRSCLGFHSKEVCCSSAQRSVACNLVFMSLHFEQMTNLDPNRYCIPMDSPRPMLPSELEFFDKGTGKGKWIQSMFWLFWKLATISTAPLVVVFTKFDGQIIQECGKLNDIEDDRAKWDMARKNAEITFQKTYLPKVMKAQYPPKAYVRLEGM